MKGLRVVALLLSAAIGADASSLDASRSRANEWRIGRSQLAHQDTAVQPAGGRSSEITAQPIPADPQERQAVGVTRARRGRSRQQIQSPGQEGTHASHQAGTDTRTPTTDFGSFDPRGRAGRNFWLTVCAAVLLGISCWWMYASNTGREHYMDPQKRGHKPVPEDTYGFALVSMIRDLHLLSQEQWQWKLRLSRLVSSCCIIALNIGLQLYMMWEIKRFVTAKWVHDIRVDYDMYQLHMYGEGHTVIAADGKHRGLPGFYNTPAFDTLDSGLKERVCNIPFSQTAFFTSILFIWSLTCVGEIRSCTSLFTTLVVTTPTIPSMAQALQVAEDDAEASHSEPPMRVVTGLTFNVKAALSAFVIMPRVILTLVLLWLGSRFLAATNDFCELVLNTIALEFLLMLKDLIYSTIVPDRNKREIQNIQLLPSTRIEHPSYWVYLGTFSWAVVAVTWVFSYVYYFQSVLPSYNWDVAAPCTPWVMTRYAV
eukprot:TRINITY_DN295_c0_g3_i1.p1 TRINITY_DN295_c0_g3~~TRINITY_DN295_c0_g3_i1.p1  ORF type:complete len:483 (+),score=54.77 TRINITY_DN295_c0_g3_i1:72-1520(+)